ncbi:hypothetical protein X797_007215 [Metarhizium robertsii]|uniref:Zinc finger domain-containing protein, CCHC-type n=2 Tax=Metarhizium robertsii TaxID=568076 RepID=A0A0B2X9J3_METRA|nr:Zinc finger domain-containing protein, CCHC-type [Metarhizium robertsii ARSEF 23]EXU99748.1 hypothetical protein X797_007215 [Metarhizium robertsii]KHO11528.1 Zinc finger domain-containing protein, CCHC-type [Metarhizium robertsii ARSEF 23]
MQNQANRGLQREAISAPGAKKMAMSPPCLPDQDEVGRSWKESVKCRDHYFSGNLDDVDGSLTVSRRPMMDAYCLFFLGIGGRNTVQELRKAAEKRTGDMYIRRGFNAVYHEEFEFFVDKLTWEKYFGRWGETRKVRWPWPTTVNSLKAGGLSLTYDRLLEASRQDNPSVSLSTPMEQSIASEKANIPQVETQPKRHRLSSRKRHRVAASSEEAGSSNTGSGQIAPADDLLAQVSYQKLEESLASINARLLQIEAYPKDSRPSSSRHTIPSAPEDVRRIMCDEGYPELIEYLVEVEKRRKKPAK